MSATVNDDFFKRLDASLAAAEAIARNPLIRTGVRAAVNVPAARVRVKLRAIPPHQKKKERHLRDAVGVSVKEDGRRIVGRVTWLRSKGGFHGPLVEKGHEIVSRGPSKSGRKSKPRPSRAKKTGGRVAGRFYLRDSWEETREAQGNNLDAAVLKALEKMKVK